MGEESSLVDKLKAQRDRFIAFAFAGADLLLEVDGNDVIAYSAGAGEAVYGLADADLFGKKLADFVYPKDRKRYDDAVQRLRNCGRLDHTPVALVGPSGGITRMRLAGIRLPQFPKSYHLVLSRIPAMTAPGPDRIAGEVDHKAQFIEMVRSRLNDSNRTGQEVTLTLFDLSGTNFAAIDPGILQSFLSTLHHTLEECSLRGASAGALSNTAFGLVHDDRMPAQAVHEKVAALAGKFGGKANGAAGVKMRSATLAMEDSTLSDDDIAKALGHIVNTFVKDSTRFMMKSLAEGAQLAVEDTLVRVRNFRRMVKGADKLVFLFQPIVNVRTGAVLKYEAFSRINHNGTSFPPTHIIPFATDVGVIGEFDLMTITKGLGMLKEPGQLSPLAQIAINVSGHSLGNPGFYQSLLALLEQNRPVLGRLVLEITDADKIYNLDEAKRLLTRIRKFGTRISLDDFGSGGSAFDLLRFLPVDFAKFDHTFMLDARAPKGRSILKAMTNLCHDMGVVIVGECVEDAAMLKLVAEIGIDYAQGYYFAQPSADAAKRITHFSEHVKRAGTMEPGLAVVG